MLTNCSTRSFKISYWPKQPVGCESLIGQVPYATRLRKVVLLAALKKNSAGSVILEDRNTRVSKDYRAFLDDWDKGFFNYNEEPDGYYLQVEGDLPRELEGTYFRNGPGNFQAGSERFNHPYDGDGMMMSISIKDGRAFFRSRFINTPERAIEQQAGRVMFRNSFATQRQGGPLANMVDMYIKNGSNTSCLVWGGKVLSFFEAALPYTLDPHTLATQGLETLGGKWRPGLPVDLGSDFMNQGFGLMQKMMHRSLSLLPDHLICAGGTAVTAHPHLDANTGRLCLFTYTMESEGVSLSGPLMNTCLTFWEFNESFQEHCSRTYRLSNYSMLHDFVVTENYYVLWENPCYVDYLPLMTGQACAASCIRWKEDTPARIHIITRPGSGADRRGEKDRVYEVPPAFIFHHANAFEVPDTEGLPGQIVMDSIHYDSLPAIGREALEEQQVDPDAGFRARLRRVVVDLLAQPFSNGRNLYSKGTVKFEDHLGVDHYLELPAVNNDKGGMRHRYVYGYASNFDDPSIALVKIDMDTGASDVWQPGLGYYCLEPEFVPRPGAIAEDDGWLLAMGYDVTCRASELLVLDATKVAQGPVTRLLLRNPVPHGLHGYWTSTHYGPEN